jgi:long-chain fatty acid transport protein
MQQHHHRRSLLVIGLAGALAATGQAYASGLQITEQSVTGLGRAFAAGSLPNDDVSAVFYNPADMMLSTGMQAQAGLTFIGISMKADNAGSATRLPANLKDVLTKPGTLPVFVTIPSFGRGHDDGGSDNVVPNAFFAMDVNDRMRFGLGMTAPFAVSTSYGRDWVGRYHAVDSELSTVDINPSLAYRMNENFSIGAGISAQYADAKLTRALFNPTTAFVKDGYVEVKADGWTVGYNLGALYELDSNTRFGVSYRSRINHSVEGDRTITDYWVPDRNGKVSTKADVTLPDWLGLAAYRRIDNQWAVMGGVRWTNWSLFKKLQLDFADGSQDLTQENWQDSWSFSIGVSYDYNPAWTFRAGYVYDQTPVPSAEYRTPRIPDSNRNAFGVGFSYRPMPQLSLDFGYMYIDFADASTDNTFNLLPAPLPSGLAIDNLKLDYTGSGNLVGIQANYRF